MSTINSNRHNCHDVFNAFLVRSAKYAGVYEFPVIRPTRCIPNRLIPFSKAVSSKDYDQWVHFFEDDYLFERLWNNPNRYLDLLKKYNGVILPDFSLYRDMPLTMQLWNIYRSRALGCWLQRKGVVVMPNMRYGDERTYSICCNGISQNGVIAVGSHGTLKNKEDRQIFAEGLEVVVKTLKPIAIVVYGAAPEDIFGPYKEQGIQIIVFESEYSRAIKRSKEVI